MNLNFCFISLYVAASAALSLSGSRPFRSSPPGPPKALPSAQTVIRDSVPRIIGDSEYVDTIYLGLNKNSYVEVKGVEPLSADVGGDKQNILIAVQENSSIVKLKALRKGFADANMIVVCKDTVLQYLIRYADNPRKNYYGYAIAGIRQKIVEERALRTPPISPLKPPPAATHPNGNQPGADSAVKMAVNPTTASTGSATIPTSPQPQPKDASDTMVTLPVTPLEHPSKDVTTLDRLRSRRVNLQIGAVSGGIRATLDRLYLDSHHRVYYAITIENREKSAFKVDYIAFQVFNKFTRYRSPLVLRHVGGRDNPASIPAGSARALVFETNPVAMLPEEILMITLAEPNKEGAREIAIRLTPTDLTRADEWKDD